MIRAAAPLLALLALAACGRGGDTSAGNQMSNPLLDPAKEMARRWGTVFGDEKRRTQAAADMGYKLGPLQQTGGSFTQTSAEQVIVVPRSPVQTRSVLRVSGAKPGVADRYAFTFDSRGDDGRDTAVATDVDKTPTRVLLGFLQRFEVQPDDDVKSTMRSLKPITKTLPGATIAFEPGRPIDAKRPRNRRSTLTITRPGAPAPAASNQTQAARN